MCYRRPGQASWCVRPESVSLYVLVSTGLDQTASRATLVCVRLQLYRHVCTSSRNAIIEKPHCQSANLISFRGQAWREATLKLALISKTSSWVLFSCSAHYDYIFFVLFRQMQEEEVTHITGIHALRQQSIGTCVGLISHYCFLN